jgi:hypothetical protein
MAIHFHILSASGALTGSVRENLDKALAESAGLCGKLLDLTDVDVVVMNQPRSVIPRIGITGWSHGAHEVTMCLDVGHDYLQRKFSHAVRSTLAHELHHCARAHALGSSHGSSYGERLVAEGLACCFEEEIGEPTPFYAVECKGEALRRFADKAKARLEKERDGVEGPWNDWMSSRDWMFGRSPDDPEFPYQCGYSIVYAVVRRWLDATGRASSDAAGAEALEIVSAWLSGELRLWASDDESAN